jgi:cytochrome b6-f complex iron-sulfur subunit
MAKRTPEEIRAQREAWLTRKAPAPVPAAASEPEQVAQVPSVAPAQAAPPPAPTGKRTPEEIRAQREAMLARKAAKAAGEPVPSAQPTAAAPAVPAPKPAAKAPAPAPPPQTDSRLSRREFLNYAWLASIALFAAETVGLSLWFAFPNFKAGQFGGEFSLGEAINILPEVNSGPKAYTDGKFWLVDVDTQVNGQPQKGVMAIYKVCTHLGCLYEWIPMTNRFECPCHGSKFELSGEYIAGPARRSLDRFVVKAVAPDGSVKETDAVGNPLAVSPTDTIIVDTGKRILGSSDIIPA